MMRSRVAFSKSSVAKPYSRLSKLSISMASVAAVCSHGKAVYRLFPITRATYRMEQISVAGGIGLTRFLGHSLFAAWTRTSHSSPIPRVIDSRAKERVLAIGGVQCEFDLITQSRPVIENIDLDLND